MAEVKPLAGMERHLLKEKIPLETPYAAYVFPTNLCNFMCEYCGHSLGLEVMQKEYDFCAKQMSMDTYQRTIDQLKEFSSPLKVISLTGHGEPLLNHKLPEMIAYAKKSKIAERIETISNASLLTQELSDRLIEAGLDCIRISLQGLSTKKYEMVCKRKIDFSKLVEEIRYLYQHRKQCKIYIKVMDVALEEGEEEIFYQIFDSISDRMYIEQCRPVYAGVKKTEQISCQEDRYGRIHEPRVVCPLCFYMIGVHPNGDVAPCETIYKPIVLGNIYQDTLYQMWNGKKNREFQIMQLQKERFQNIGCAHCCAPDDVAHPEDELDGMEQELMEKIQNL